MVRDLRERTGREIVLIAEDERANPRLPRPAGEGGVGLDAIWNDDFHHALHAVLVGERNGYYADYAGFADPEDLARAYAQGLVYQGRYSSFHKAARGAPPRGLSGERFTAYSQNHDQIGNRPDGARLIALTDASRARLAAALTLLSPFTPLLFMGEEYGERAPFHYFIDFAHPGLNEAVRRGRRRDLRPFGWRKRQPDPAGETTFTASVLHWDRRETPEGREMLALYSALLRLRRECDPLRNPDPASVHADVPVPGLLRVLRRDETGEREALCLFNCSPEAATVPEAAESRPGEEKPRWSPPLLASGYRPPEAASAAPDAPPDGKAAPARLAPWGFAVLARTTRSAEK